VEFVVQVLLHKKRGVGGVPLEVLQEKRGVGLQLHVFLGAEFVELDVFGTVELERSWKNGSRAVPSTPLYPGGQPDSYRAGLPNKRLLTCHGD
jgi:hypothetical protein